ncbi:MAG: ABC transporter permease subunit [Lachnospiraceae bacterium]|nr:ABC transporter permease subunit [Lachnospiraceae bacterium]
MKKKITFSFVLAHILLIVLVCLIFTPGEKQVTTINSFLGAVAVMEIFYLFQLVRAEKKGKSAKAPSDIMVLLWGFLILWEVAVTKKQLLHPVLFPAPENVFHVFPTQYEALMKNVLSSMELLAVGLLIGITLGVVLGVICGWFSRLTDIFYPVASVLAPIPAVVYAPYIIILMPSFRSASAVIIILGIFFPTFLKMILRVGSIDPRILDSGRVLNIGSFQMITKILLPYIMPEVISGLRITVTTSISLLIFAEMMGATEGMGYYIVNFNTYANYTNVIAGFIVIGIVITILGYVVSFIEKHAVKWQ